MSAYISLINFTDQGARNAKDTVDRALAFDKLLVSLGGRKIGVWWTMGQYDLVYVFEAPDDAAAVTALASVSKLGNVRTSTMRAFSEEESAKIFGAVK